MIIRVSGSIIHFQGRVSPIGWERDLHDLVSKKMSPERGGWRSRSRLTLSQVLATNHPFTRDRSNWHIGVFCFGVGDYQVFLVCQLSLQLQSSLILGILFLQHFSLWHLQVLVLSLSTFLWHLSGYLNLFLKTAIFLI